jgi:tetratricopeptide (TPR) repeat protein
MKSFILFLLTLLCVKNASIAQDRIIDPSLSLLRTSKDDTSTVKDMNEISYYYRNKHPDTGLSYGKRALLLSEKLNWKAGIAKSYNCIGNNYFFLSDPTNAMEYYQKALKIYEQIEDEQGIAWSVNYIGTVYLYLMSDYQKALEYHERSLKLFEKINDKKGMATGLDNLGVVYENMGDYTKTLKYFQQAESINEKIDNKEGLATNSAHMGIFYDDLSEYSKALEYCKKSLSLFNNAGNKVGVASDLISIGNIYIDLSNYNDALTYFQKAIEMYEQIGQKLGIAKSFGNMGLVYATVLNYSEAMKCYQQSFVLNRELGNKSGMAGALSNIVYVYLNSPDSFMNKLGYRGGRRYSIALETINQSLKLSREIGELELQQFSLKFLSSVYAKQKKFLNAYETYKDYVVIHDSISNDEKKKQITHKEIEYEYDKKEEALKASQEQKDALAIAEIKRQTLIRNYTIGGVGVVGLFSFLMILSYNKRRKSIFDKRVSEVEMKAMHLQMNPHFIFNCMHSINKYVMDNEKQLASEYLIRFSKLMRLILENSREKEVSLGKDLSALELYMQLEALRFKNKFQYIIHVDPEIDLENTLIPPMLLQPFVENSIIHGVQNKEGGLIKISVNKEENMFRCIVEDNGIGRKQSIVFKSDGDTKRESLGMKITEERLEIINKLKKVKTSIVIIDLKEIDKTMSGLRIELLLPFESAF